MSLSKETEVIYDEHRGVDYDSANPPLFNISSKSAWWQCKI